MCLDAECIRRESIDLYRESTLCVGSEKWTDEALARAALQGCKEARNTLFVRQSPLIKKLAGPARKLLRIAVWGGRVNVPIEAEDIDQQAFVAFCDILAAWCPDRETFVKCLGRRLPWMLRDYVKDAVLGKHRPRHGAHLASTRPLAPFENAEEIYLSGANSSDDGESSVAWGLQVSSLPAPLRLTVQLRFYHDLTSTQIARITGTTQREVNRSLQTAILIMRQELQDDWEGV